MGQTYLAPGVKAQMRKKAKGKKHGAAAVAPGGGGYGLGSVLHKKATPPKGKD